MLAGPHCEQPRLRAMRSSEKIKFATSCRNGRTRTTAAAENIHFARCDTADGIFQSDCADQIVHDARRVRFKIDIVVSGLMNFSEDLVQTWTSKIAVDEENAMTLLGESESVVRAGKTFSLVWQRAGK